MPLKRNLRPRFGFVRPCEKPSAFSSNVLTPVFVVIGTKVADETRVLMHIGLGFRKLRILSHTLDKLTGRIRIATGGYLHRVGRIDHL